MEIQHFSHHHPLTLVLLNEVKYDHCNICWKESAIDSDHYGCKVCDFYIHKSCVEYPRELQHPSHPKHLLLLELHRMEPCANCSSNMFEFKYKCPHCHESLYLCPECAFLPLTKKAENHDHPLTLMRKLLPFLCNGCAKEDIGMFYFCSTCSYMVHSKCTSLPLIVRPPTIQAAIHNHPLTLEMRLFLFTCDACGNEGKGAFYFCVTCSFVAHPDCAFLPSIVKIIRHKHPLNLIYSLPADQSKRRVVCQLCAKIVDTNYWLYYYCSSHDFVAHLHCSTKEEERDETFVPNYEDEESIESLSSMLKHEEDHRDKYIDLLSYIVKKTKPGGDNIEIHTEIKHFSHEHDLKLTDEIEIDKKCDACIQSIFPPFYACAQCGFFLHKSCVELPRKLQNSLHRHPLKLLSREHDYLFRCNACYRPCNGFNYRCDECNFDLDIQCSLVRDIFTHPSHDHEHQLILARPSDKMCSCCGSKDGFKFSCVDCEFTLDFKCLTLPRTISYEKHDHPFTLCYTSEDDSGEYYCDICEKKRDPKCWFYYCADCSYLAHHECILGELPNLKYGETCELDIRQRALVLDPKNIPDDVCRIM